MVEKEKENERTRESARKKAQKKKHKMQQIFYVSAHADNVCHELH